MIDDAARSLSISHLIRLRRPDRSGWPSCIHPPTHSTTRSTPPRPPPCLPRNRRIATRFSSFDRVVEDAPKNSFSSFVVVVVVVVVVVAVVAVVVVVTHRTRTRAAKKKTKQK